MKKKRMNAGFSKRMLCAGSLALFCAVSFPLVTNAATAVPQPGESIRGTRPEQQVSLENVWNLEKQCLIMKKQILVLI